MQIDPSVTAQYHQTEQVLSLKEQKNPLHTKRQTHSHVEAQASSVGEVRRKVVYDRMRAWRQNKTPKRYTDLRLSARVFVVGICLSLFGCATPVCILLEHFISCP